MTTITRERLEWLSNISGRDDIEDICGDEIRELARIALASLDAGSNSHPAHGSLSNYRLHRIREILGKAAAQSDGGNLGYVMSDAVKAIDELLEMRKAEPVAFINGAWTLVYYRPPKEAGLKIGDKLYAAPPEPVVQETAHSSVIAEQLSHVLSGMDATGHQRAVISCAVDRLNKVADILQLAPSSLSVPEGLDYQSAKELYNYLMTEEEINATVNAWNACRAAMLNGGKS